MAAQQPLDVAAARAQFPALAQDQIFLDNAGGSQVLGSVIESISTYLSTTNVQLGASYRTSSISTSAYDQGYASAASYIHASPDSIVLGSSTTQLFSNLSSALTLPKGSTLVLSKHEHETNVSPWVRLAARLGLEVKWWVGTAEEDFMLTPANLAPLLDEGVSFVACTHASNVLGGITDVKAIADAVHKVGGLLCVDGVSYAPHRSIDVCALGVDFYGFSWYKVYGPHIAQLYASPAGLAAVASLGHFFNPSETLEDKLGFAGSCYEAVQALPKVVEYLAGKQAGITAHEERLQSILLEFLNGRKDVRVLGSRSSDAGVRVATVSFVVDGKGSKGVVEAVEGVSNVGVRWGHFYSKRLCDEVLGLGPEGVVRVSMVHYNTEEEIRKLVDVLGQVLGGD